MITAIITPPCNGFESVETLNLNLPTGLISMRAWPQGKEKPSHQTIVGNLHYCSLEDYYRPDFLDAMPQGWERLEAYQGWQRDLWRWIGTFLPLDSLKPGYFKPDGGYVSAEKTKVRLPNRVTYLRQFFGDDREGWFWDAAYTDPNPNQYWEDNYPNMD